MSRKKNLRARKLGSLALVIMMLCILLSSCGTPKLPENLDKVKKETVNVILEATPVIESGSTGGEFALKGLVDSGVKVDDNIGKYYYTSLCRKLKKSNGVLSEDMYTEYARAAIGVMAIGKNPEDVEGYNLIAPLDEYKILQDQGVHAEAHAVIAARMAGVKLKSEALYIEDMVKDIEGTGCKKNEFASDYIAIDLEGLSMIPKKERNKAVNDAIEKGISYLSKCQKEDGSLGNSDSTSVAIIALTQLDVDIFKDERFIKNGKTLADGQMKYYLKNGGFRYTDEQKKINGMSTESGLLALDAMSYQQAGKRLYENKNK